MASLVFAALTLPAAGEEPPGPPKELLERRVVLSVPGMDRVRVRRELSYKSGGTPLGMDVYLPSDIPPRSGWPAVIFVHGGPVPADWAPKNWGAYRSYGELIAASGLAAVTFNHRLNAPMDYPRAAGDVAALLDHVRANARDLELDPDRMAVWAFSGGGPLLASVLGQRPAYLRAAVSYYAYLASPPGTPPDSRLSAVEQLRQAGVSVPPLLVARAGRDDAALNAAVDEFVRVALEKQVTLEMLTHPAGRHGFDIFDDDERSRVIIRRTVAFLRENLGTP